MRQFDRQFLLRLAAMLQHESPRRPQADGRDHRRRFESDYAGAAVPSATIQVSAKLVHLASQQVVASRTFLQARPAASTEIPDVVQAFEQALEAITGDLAGWTLRSDSTPQPRPSIPQ